MRYDASECDLTVLFGNIYLRSVVNLSERKYNNVCKQVVRGYMSCHHFDRRRPYPPWLAIVYNCVRSSWDHFFR